MARGSKTELYAAIRRDVRQGATVRAVMRDRQVGYRTVQAALRSAWPAERKPLPPRGSRLDVYAPVVDEMLRADLDAPVKQRHTARRVWARLVEEHGVDPAVVSYWMVSRYVAARRPAIAAEAGRFVDEGFVPQMHLPGAEAEVDFGDVTVRLAGQQVVCALFSFRLSYSGKAVHRIFASAGQEAFLEGHVHAFRSLGGLPRGKVRYDNLKAAVSQVLGFTRARVESDRWTAFRSHYGFEAFYCQPGQRGAHEKGGVEGDIGRFRRNHLVPVPDVGSLAELNRMVDSWDAADDARRIGGRVRTVGELFAVEAPVLRPLPEENFGTGTWFTPRVDRYAQVMVRMNRYSVPARLIGRRVRVLLHASDLVVYDGHAEVARHERVVGKGGVRLNLDHYLEVLARKPGALPGSAALYQARASGRFTRAHDAWWAAACKAHGDSEGTKELVEVLLLHRHLSDEHIEAGLAAALAVGAFTADVVALEARRAVERASTEPVPSTSVGKAAEVSSLTMRRLASLPPDTRPLPDVRAYDDLLPSRRRDGGAS